MEIFDESTADDMLYFYLFNVNNDHDNKKKLHINAIQEFTELAIMANEPFYIMLINTVTVKQQLLFQSFLLDIR